MYNKFIVKFGLNILILVLSYWKQ